MQKKKVNTRKQEKTFEEFDFGGDAAEKNRLLKRPTSKWLSPDWAFAAKVLAYPEHLQSFNETLRDRNKLFKKELKLKINGHGRYRKKGPKKTEAYSAASVVDDINELERCTTEVAESLGKPISKVKDIDRARYFAERDISTEPDFTSAYELTKRYQQRIKYTRLIWKKDNN
jgi:hypothetical protein